LNNRIALDTGPQSLLCHRKISLPDVREIRQWLRTQTDVGAVIYVPEIADYELRRDLLRARKTASVRRLDALIAELDYLPLDTPAMRRPAELWAQARNMGLPTAPPEALDGDVIIAAQAESAQAVVATVNVGHLSRFITARHWRDIT
jgi:predicted nucleic acid-binding protein